MEDSRRQKLRKMMRERRLVRFNHRFGDSRIHGYILDVGPKFFLLALVSDGLWLKGFDCFRINDIRELMVDPYGAFAEAALKKRGERVKKPRVSVKDITKLLTSANRAFALVTIHREKVDPDVCWIGRIVRVEHGRVSLLKIEPGAIWDDEPTDYDLNEITRVSFGGNYEEALYLIGGDPVAH